jgi:hypothetical protein
VLAWINRSTVTFIVNETLGVMIVLHELFLRDGERPFFLALAAGLMGLPFMLAADGKVLQRRNGKEDDTDRWSHLP